MMADKNAASQTELTFTIGDLAEQLDISTRTIRYYEERGLINPQRTSGGQRVYTRRDRGRLKLILRAKRAGFGLEESKPVLDLYDIVPSEHLHAAQAEKLERMVTRRVAELDEKIIEMSRLRDDLQTFLANLRQQPHGTD